MGTKTWNMDMPVTLHPVFAHDQVRIARDKDDLSYMACKLIQKFYKCTFSRYLHMPRRTETEPGFGRRRIIFDNVNSANI